MLIKNTAYISAGLILSITLGVVVNKLVVLYYPYEYLGYMGLVRTYISTIMTLFLFGTNYSYVFLYKEYSQKKQPITLLNADVFSFVAVNIILGICIVLFYALARKNLSSYIVLISTVFAATLAWASILRQYDAARDIFKGYLLFSPLLNIFLISSVVFGFFIKIDLLHLLFLFGLISAVGCFFFIKSRYQDLLSRAQLRNYLLFFKKNLSVSKFFFIHALANSTLISLLSSLLLLKDKVSLTEFVAYRQAGNYNIYLQTVIGAYLFPKLVADNRSRHQHVIGDFVYILLMVLAVFFFLFFDKFIWLFYSKGFVHLSLAFYFIMNSQMLDVMTTPHLTRYQTDLQFSLIFKVYFLSVLPLLFFIVGAYFDFIAFDFSMFTFLIFLFNFAMYAMLSFLNRISNKKYFLITGSYIILFLINLKVFIL